MTAAGGTYAWRAHHFFQWPLPKYLQPKELGCFPKQPSFLQAEHHAVPGGPVTPAACSPALPCCEGVRRDQPQDMARGDPGEIPCSHECTPKGAALSIPRAASAVGSVQGGLRELHRPSSPAEQGPGEDVKTPQSPSPLLQLAASVQEEGACPSARDAVRKGRARGAERPWAAVALAVPAGAGSPHRRFRGTEERCAGPLNFCWKPGSPAGLVGCFGACCQVLENCPNLCFLQALFSAGGGGNSCIKMETHPFCQAINSASYGNREVPAFTLCFCTELPSLFLCPDLAKHLSLNVALCVS
ncbi:uncharacterized protein WM294_012863 [Sarcoramphus papa]